MTESELDLDMDELSSAEDFLEYFKVDFEPAVVQVNRLHILQRFHDYISNAEDEIPQDDEQRFELYAGMLNSAYNDFVHSDAQTEKVFKVFRMFEPVNAFIPLTEFKQQVASGAPKV